MAHRKRVYFLVSFIPPPGATDERMKEYIIDSVAAMKGSLYSGGFEGEGDPMFELDEKTVRARKLPLWGE